MLYTNLNHIENSASHSKEVAENENVMMICGRMDPSSVLVYRIAETLQQKYKHVKFFDLECDHPDFKDFLTTSSLHENRFPLLLFFKNNEMKKVVSGIKSKDDILRELDNVFNDN